MSALEVPDGEVLDIDVLGGDVPVVPSPPLRLVPPTRGDRELLEDLLSGKPVHLTTVDLVALANEEYEGLDPQRDPAELSAALVALDAVLSQVGDEQAVNGERAQQLHYDYCRYVLPYLLERRGAATAPLPFGQLRTADVTHLRNVLSGKQGLPAAVLVQERMPRSRLALTCVWLTLPEAAAACDHAEARIRDLVTVHRDSGGLELVFAGDLRAAGLLDHLGQRAHGLRREAAGNVLALLQRLWTRSELLGVDLPGNPRLVKAQRPRAGQRQRAPKAAARGYVSVSQCLLIAGELHVVHQLVLWLLRLVGLRDSEVFGLLVRDWQPGYLHVRRIGGASRLAREEDGQLVRTQFRSGTKGSVEGEVPLGAHDEEGDGIRSRHLRLAAVVDRLIATVVGVFHTDPETGLVDLDARLVPGLQDDDSAGMSTFSGALTAACKRLAGQVPACTPHDQRASLNTDLGNAEVKGRVRRYYLGHRSKDGKALDVNEKHYDLGPDSKQLQKAAKAINGLVPEGVSLLVATDRRPQWGAGSRMAARRTHVQARLDELGLGGTAQDMGVPQAAARLGLSTSQVKRMCEDGRLAAVPRTWGTREVWAISQESVEAEASRRQLVTLPQLAERLGLERPSLWSLVRELGLCAARGAGEHLRLTPEEVLCVEQELETRAAEAAAVVPMASAATRLGLPESAVQTLVRRGELEVAHAGGRAVCLTASSVDAFDAAHPRPEPVQPDEPVLPVADAAYVLGENRHGMGHLVRGRQLATTSRDRRQVVGLRSVEALLRRSPRPGAAQRLATVMAMAMLP